MIVYCIQTQIFSNIRRNCKVVELLEEDLQQIIGGYQEQKPKKDTTKVKPPKTKEPHDSVYVDPPRAVPTFGVTPH
jgi:hypothetical protein